MSECCFVDAPPRRRRVFDLRRLLRRSCLIFLDGDGRTLRLCRADLEPRCVQVTYYILHIIMCACDVRCSCGCERVRHYVLMALSSRPLMSVFVRAPWAAALAAVDIVRARASASGRRGERAAASTHASRTLLRSCVRVSGRTHARRIASRASPARSTRPS